MGLDIIAYGGLELIAAGPYEQDDSRDWEQAANHVYLDVDAEHYERQADSLARGWYRVANDTPDAPDGPSMAYSTYNRFREWLASLVGTTPERVWGGEPAPRLNDLINFSDCEGVLGPKTSAALATDLRLVLETVPSERSDEVERHVKRAERLLACLEYAATHNGAVVYS